MLGRKSPHLASPRSRTTPSPNSSPEPTTTPATQKEKSHITKITPQEKSPKRESGVLTLAAAYASDGRFDEAIAVQQRVISIAVELNAAGIEEAARGRLLLYKRNEPVIDKG